MMFTSFVAMPKIGDPRTLEKHYYIKIQALVIGMIIALVIIGLVSLINYELIDERIRNQRDVLKRRIIFFTSIILSPIIWYCLFAFVLYKSIHGKNRGIYYT